MKFWRDMLWATIGAAFAVVFLHCRITSALFGIWIFETVDLFIIAWREGLFKK